MNHPAVYLRGTCRACRGPLQEVLSLGPHRLNAFPRYRWELEQIHRVPLILTVCTHCGLAQLDRTVPPDWLYRHYWYRSGVNETMVQELQGIVDAAVARVPVGSGDKVLDIGANDGTLLHHYGTLYGDCPMRWAVEPALNLQDRLRPHCEAVVPDYFPCSHLTGQRFKIITAIACCYDVEDPRAFFQAIHDLLAPGGVAIIQFQDLGQQLAASAFDNICHEHLEYYSYWALSHLFIQTGLVAESVCRRAINGGSLRIYLRRQEDGLPGDRTISDQMLQEAQQQLATPLLRDGDLSAFTRFRTQVNRVKDHVRSSLELAHQQGVTVDLYGASTKGNILLQTLDVGPELVRQAIDRSPEKAGCLTITGIPIVGEEEGRKDPAGLWLVPIWQFREHVVQRERWYLEAGGTMLFPLPYPEVVRG